MYFYFLMLYVGCLMRLMIDDGTQKDNLDLLIYLIHGPNRKQLRLEPRLSEGQVADPRGTFLFT